MSSLWEERYNSLSTAERQKVDAGIKADPTKPDPDRVLRALQQAHKQMVEGPAAMADQVSSMDSFDLDKLDDVAKDYDEICTENQNEEERRMASLARLVGDFASIASDPQRSSEDRLAAELDIHNMNVHSKVIVPLTSCLRQIQSFNVEKRFGFVEDSYQALSNDDKKRRGEDVPAELPMSFRQQCNDPFKPIVPVSQPRKEKKKKKKTRGLKALAELQCSYELNIDEMQDIGNTISDTEVPYEIPDLAASFTYADVPVPEDIPNRIRQHFFDAEFTFQEVLALQDEATNQLVNVRSAFVVWYRASSEVWYVQLRETPRIRASRSEAYETLSSEKLAAHGMSLDPSF